MSYPEERDAITKVLRESVDPVCVELGAMDGGDAEWLLPAMSGTSRLFLVEADPYNFNLMIEKKVQARLITWAAIAAVRGKVQFYANRDAGGGFGSICKPLQGLSVDMSKFYVEQVPSITFDKYFDMLDITKIDMLIVDIHGAEKDMIRNGQRALSKTRYLFIEAFPNRLYEGMATEAELIEMLPGWTVVEKFPWNIMLRNEKYAA